MAARSTTAEPGSRRALLAAAAAGVAALAAERVARPLEARADTGDPLIQGQYNFADATTTLESSAASALVVEGAQFGLSAMGEEYGISATSEGTTGGWPRAIIANGNEGATGLHAASWAPGGGGGWGDGDAVVAETRNGKALRGSAMGTGYGLYAESAHGHGAFIRGSGERGLDVEGKTGGMIVTTVGGHALTASGEWGIHAAARGESGARSAVSGAAFHDGTGIHGTSNAGAIDASPGLGAGDGVHGETGTGVGVRARAHGTNGMGIHARADHGTGLRVESLDGLGAEVQGAGMGLAVDAQQWGLFANTHQAGNNTAVVGNGKSDGDGVSGNSIADDGWIPNGAGYGVRGSSGSGGGVRGDASLQGGTGVFGYAAHGTGVRAESPDGIGLDASGTETAIHASSTRAGLIADCQMSGDWGVAVLGHGFKNAVGVVGRCLAGTGFDAGGSDSGVAGDSGSGPGVKGESVSGPGVYGGSQSGPGVRGYGARAGLLGSSMRAGVVGLAGIDPDDVTWPAKIGVYGYAPVDSAGRGVYGRAVAGRGVHGLATTGQGVRGEATTGYGCQGYATTGTAGYFATQKPGALYTGYALRAVGRVKLDKCAGIATIAAATKSVKVPLEVDLVSTSAVVATLQGNAGSGVTVERVALDTTGNAFTIYLTKASSANVKVAWIVLG